MRVRSQVGNDSFVLLELYVIIDSNLLGTILASSLNVEHISLIPITIVNLIKSIIAGVE